MDELPKLVSNPLRVAKRVAKGIKNWKKAVKFVGNNWRDPKSGQSLFLEMPGRKRVHSRKPASRGNSAVAKRFKSKKYSSRRGTTSTVVGKHYKRRFRTGQSKWERNLFYKFMQNNAACNVKRSREMNSVAFSSEEWVFLEDAPYQFSVLNPEADTMEMDFGRGYLNGFQVTNYGTTAATQASYAAQPLSLHRYKPRDATSGREVAAPRLIMQPVKNTYHMKNNSLLQAIVHIRVYKAKIDIPGSVQAGPTGDPGTAFSPVNLYIRYLASDKGQNSNMSEANLPNNYPMFLSDANPLIKTYWKLVRSQKLVLEPGDEYTYYLNAPKRILNLQTLYHKQCMGYDTVNNVQAGYYMFRGDYLVIMAFRGGLGHETTNRAVIGSVGIDNDAVGDNYQAIDIERLQTIKGKLLHNLTNTYYNYTNEGSVIPLNKSYQAGTAVTENI